MDSYASRAIGQGSVQTVTKATKAVTKGADASGDARLGSGAAYGFVYPNFMLNRYGYP